MEGCSREQARAGRKCMTLALLLVRTRVTSDEWSVPGFGWFACGWLGVVPRREVMRVKWGWKKRRLGLIEGFKFGKLRSFGCIVNMPQLAPSYMLVRNNSSKQSIIFLKTSGRQPVKQGLPMSSFGTFRCQLRTSSAYLLRHSHHRVYISLRIKRA